MPIISVLILALSGSVAPVQKLQNYLSLDEIVRVASIAARDDGFIVGYNSELEEMRTENGKEPYPGYASVALEQDGQVVHFYSIRVETGDIVDPVNCKVFRYPDLITYKAQTLRKYHTKEVSNDVIEDEVGCGPMETVPHRSN